MTADTQTGRQPEDRMPLVPSCSGRTCLWLE